MSRWKRRLAARRLRPGDGRPLPPFRWWQVVTRTLFVIDATEPGAHPARVSASYAVDIRQWGDRDDGDVRARLYRDGALEAVSRLPARFPVAGGEIEVALGNFGVKRCHLIAPDGSERQLRPHPRSAEGRRASLERNHPALSRAIGAISTVAVLIGLVLTVPEILSTISQVPPIAESIGSFEVPIDLPTSLTIALGVGAVLGSVERALRLRSSWLDDLAS